MTINDAAKLTR